MRQLWIGIMVTRLRETVLRSSVKLRRGIMGYKAWLDVVGSV
ncbi:hypothetical protein A2U01_0087095, partial [Trifolium medium]|nr:hypothetical protein [Trifolium medium]